MSKYYNCYYGGRRNNKTVEVLNNLYEFIVTDKFEKTIVVLSNKRLKLIYSEKYVFKLEEKIKELEEELKEKDLAWKDMFFSWESQTNTIGKAVRYIEDNYTNEDGTIWHPAMIEMYHILKGKNNEI